MIIDKCLYYVCPPPLLPSPPPPRESQAAGQQLQSRLDMLRTELETESQESSLLREALRHTQSRLEHEIDVNTRAVKSRKV